MELKKFLYRHKGAFLLLLLLFAALSNALLHVPKRGKLYGNIHLKGEVINTSYGMAYIRTERGLIFKLYPPKGKKLFVSDTVEVWGKAHGFRIKVEKLKVYRSSLQRLRVKIHTLLKERFLKTAKSKFERKLGSALLFGENWFSRKEKLKMSHLGIYHIIVISGLHYALIFTFFLIFPVRWKLRYWLALAFFTFFTFLILFPKAPAYRSFISFFLFLTAKLIERRYNSLKALLFAATLWLLVYPYWVFNFGFWLSYLASLSLILYYGSQKTPEENFFKNFFGKVLGLEATLVVTVVISPLLVYLLHYLSFGGFLYAWIFTLLAVVFLFISLLNAFTFWSLPPFLEIQHLTANLFEEVFYRVPTGVYITTSKIPLWEACLVVAIALLTVSLPIPKKWIVLTLLLLVEMLIFLIPL